MHRQCISMFQFRRGAMDRARSLTGRKRLLELVGLVRVGNAERVQVLGAADLELGDPVALLDLDALRVLSARRQEELLDVVDLLGLRARARGKVSRRGSGQWRRELLTISKEA